MKITRIRKFKHNKTAEVTIRVSGAESEALSHAIMCEDTCEFSSIQQQGKNLLSQLYTKAFGRLWERSF